MSIKLYNSLSKKKEELKPIRKKQIGLYTCGLTVYDYAHIGHLAAYITWDVLKRFLSSQGYKVKHVMNLTDVGHLTSDADEGEDKMQAASIKQGKTAWDIADFFIKAFKEDLIAINILPPNKWMRATKTIKEQINFVKILEEKGYLYKISDGLYFDTSKIDNYGQLANLADVDLQEGARVAKNPEKKNASDFAVWKFSAKGSQRDMEWDSPWGKGFPGWHLECSVMSRMELGDTFDIHTGGIDHLTVHHPNEMAQSEAVTGQLQANYWLHNAFVKVDGVKMSKSAGGFIRLNDLVEKNINPASFRLLVLQNHYRKPLNFTWTSLKAAQSGLINIIRAIAGYDKPKIGCAELEGKFYDALSDDINTAQALAVLQAVIDSDYPGSAKLESILKMDEVLGLGLAQLRKKARVIPAKTKKILRQREQARAAKDWELSDKLREDLIRDGIEVNDTANGQVAVNINL